MEVRCGTLQRAWLMYYVHSSSSSSNSVSRADLCELTQNTPTEPSCISSTRAFALESSTRSESINALSAVLSTEGRVVGLCWEHLKPKGPKGLVGSERGAWTFGAVDYMLTGRRGTHLQMNVSGTFGGNSTSVRNKCVRTEKGSVSVLTRKNFRSQSCSPSRIGRL